MAITPAKNFRLSRSDLQALKAVARRYKTSETEAIRILIRRENDSSFENLFSKEELSALHVLSEREKRAPYTQAALIVRKALEFEGLLSVADEEDVERPIERNP